MADAPEPITSPPSTVHYDATSDAAVDVWVKTSANVPGGSESLWRTEIPGDGGPWQQT